MGNGCHGGTWSERESDRKSLGIESSGEILLGLKTPPHPAAMLCIGGQALAGGRKKLPAR